ncbi:MAG: sigma-70 family RNA polymerase sigma factor [Solirubrobacteraceae bacterium]
MTPLLSSALLATQTDARLLALAAAGHDRAFEAIVERYRRPLSRYLRRLLSGPLAEDALQATFVNAWRSLQGGTDVRDLRPWLYRIAHNQAVNSLARAEPRPLVEAETDQFAATTAGPDTEVEQRDTLQRAFVAIAGLPDRQRAALVAIAVEDRPHPDVARELGLTEGALRQLIHRARTTLRAAATAVVPVPLVTVVFAGGSDTTMARVAEVAAGAGGAGLGVKTGAALLAAGAMVVGAPAVHEQRAHPGPPPVTERADVRATPHRAVARPAPSPVRAVRASPRVGSAPVRHVVPRPAAPARRRHGVVPPPTAERERHQGKEDVRAPSESEGHGNSGRDDRQAEPVSSGSGSGDADSSSGTSRDGSAGTATRESSRSGSGSGDGSAEEALAPVEATSGEGSNSSGPGPGSGDDLPSLP